MNDDEMRAETRRVVKNLTPNEFKGLIIMTISGIDVRTSNVWERVKTIFLIQDDKPTPHPTAFMEMAEIAKERNQKEGKT